MKITAQVTISRNSHDEISIRIVDCASREKFIDVRMSLDKFASAITGSAMVEVPVEVHGIENIGKQKIIESRTAICPLNTSDKQKIQTWLLENCQENGWEINDYLGSQHSIVHLPEGVKINYSVIRYEDAELSPNPTIDN